MPALPLRVGLVGYGLAGEVIHAPLIAACPDMRLAAVVTRSPERITRMQAAHPHAMAVPDVDALLGDLGLDLVVVAGPNETHVDHARAALVAGCAVVVDKPLAVTAADAAALVDTAAAAGPVLTVFQNRRWDSDQLTLARLVDSGELGTVYRHESRFERWRPNLDPAKWRETFPVSRGGGQLIDLGSHLVDQAVQVFGPVVTVYAEIAARRGGADDDAFLALQHAPGTASHLSIGAVFGAPGPRRRVVGERGAYVVDHLDGQEDQLRASMQPSDDGFGVEPPERWGRLVRGDDVRPVRSERGRWADFYPAVASAVHGERPPPVDPQDAVEILRVLEAARVSASEETVFRL